MSDFLPAVIVEPQKPANAAVIWLHGLGASGHDFEPIVPHLNLPANLQVRFIFPHAPEIPVTINGGMTMPAWYDILEMDFKRKVDIGHIENSAAEVHKLIQREIDRGIPSDKIVVAGFSQGGAVAYQAALSFDKPLAGMMNLSTYFATSETLKPHAANKNIPIHLYHGSADPVVPEALGKEALQLLEKMGYKAAYKSYLMQHQVCPEQIADIGVWLEQVLL